MSVVVNSGLRGFMLLFFWLLYWVSLLLFVKVFALLGARSFVYGFVLCFVFFHYFVCGVRVFFLFVGG